MKVLMLLFLGANLINNPGFYMTSQNHIPYVYFNSLSFILYVHFRVLGQGLYTLCTLYPKDTIQHVFFGLNYNDVG